MSERGQRTKESEYEHDTFKVIPHADHVKVVFKKPEMELKHKVFELCEIAATYQRPVVIEVPQGQRSMYYSGPVTISLEDAMALKNSIDTLFAKMKSDPIDVVAEKNRPKELSS
jgi:hypothetical protein